MSDSERLIFLLAPRSRLLNGVQTPGGQASQFTIPNNYAVVDNVQWLKGDHVMTFGFSYMWEGLNNANPDTLTNILPLHYGQAPTASYTEGATGCGTGVQGCSNSIDTSLIRNR